MSNKGKEGAFDRIAKRSNKESKAFVAKSLDVSEQVYKILEEKGMTQKELASILNKTEAEISKWLSGLHNLTLKSIVKLELALDEDIILTSSRASEMYAEILMFNSFSSNQFQSLEKKSSVIQKKEREGNIIFLPRSKDHNELNKNELFAPKAV